MDMASDTHIDLFGGKKPWSSADWTDSDDRVRGGKSQSYLVAEKSNARFYGHLDIKTLGGAGFASQRTTDQKWDLSEYDGITIRVHEADEKKYTIILKDTLLPKDPDTGREQSTVSYEYDFSASSPQATITFAWSDLKATYRGREQKDAKPLDTCSIKQISIMMRSFFGTQEGPFSITLDTISAFCDKDESGSTHDDLTLEKDRTNANERSGIGQLAAKCCNVM